MRAIAPAITTTIEGPHLVSILGNRLTQLIETLVEFYVREIDRLWHILILINVASHHEITLRILPSIDKVRER
jgi:hypothetical protein